MSTIEFAIPKVAWAVVLIVSVACAPRTFYELDSYVCELGSGTLFTSSELQESWYGPHFVAASERNLCEYAEGRPEVYRFTWLRSFDEPVFVRIEFSDSPSASLHAKVLDGAGGYDPGVLIVDRTLSLDGQQSKHVRQLLNEMAFWSPVTRVIAHGDVGTDGSQWILEGVRRGEYRVLDVWTPNHSNLIRRFGMDVLRMAGVLPPDTESIYHPAEGTEDCRTWEPPILGKPSVYAGNCKRSARNDL